MGNCCSGTTSLVNEYVNKGTVHNYQRHHVSFNQLDKYDQFYKTVAHPFLDIPIEEFIDDLRDLLHKIDDEKKAKGIIKYDFDQMPLGQFMNHFNSP
jgi:hypothetical protein